MKYAFLTLYIMLLMSAGYSCKAGINNGGKQKQLSKKDLIVDMALIYGGNTQRDVVWDKDHFEPYISYTDRTNQKHWLFDGFLLLDLADGKGKIFATGYHGTPAAKNEWDSLIDYFFTPERSIDAIDKGVAARIPVLGKPPYKRKVVIGLPEPIVAGPDSYYKEVPADYWGTLDGHKLDFTKQDDRIAACKYYIDRVKKKFKERKFKNLELAGFYWIAEESLHTKSILPAVGEYLQAAGLSFYWIPYWKDNPDYFQWKDLGFHTTYLQPNYFFNSKVPYSRLDEACKQAFEHNLDLELEFDLNVLVEKGDRSAKLYDYMKAFKQNGVLANKRIAYYQDCDAVYQLYRSSNEKDKTLFHDFCSFVIEHGATYRKEDK